MKLYLCILLLSALQTINVEAAFCGCDSCTEDVLNSLADGSTCGDRINWVVENLGYSQVDACNRIGDEYPSICGMCDTDRCGPSPATTPPTPSTPNSSGDQKNNNVEAAFCGCDSCTEDVLNSLADGSTCGDRINWVVENLGYSQEDACKRIGDEYPSICGMCDTDRCGSSPATTPPTPSTPSTPHSSGDQKCGGAVDFTKDSSQACQTYLWGPTGDRSMPCFAYGGSGDPCHLNNNNDPNDGIFKDPSHCFGDTFYLWDEPDTQGRDYSWAGTTWLEYSKRFSREIELMKSQGTKVTGPLLKAGDNGVLDHNMRTFFNACGEACSDPNDPAYIDVVAINGFCGPWNGEGGCRAGAKFINKQAVSVSVTSNNLPVYITNWSRLRTTHPSEQLDAINAIDEFFPASSVVKRVYWFGARDYGGGAGTTGYLTNILPDGRTLGEVWRAKCDDMNILVHDPSLVGPAGVGLDVPGGLRLAYQ